MRKIYLNQLPRQQALTIWLKRTTLPKREELIGVREALGRVTAWAVFAKRSMPSFHAAAMDGFAVRAERTYSASDQQPLTLELGEDYLPVDTGDPLPEGFDAVIKIEDIQPLTEQSLELITPAVPWQHVRPVGEDVVAQEMIIPVFHHLQPPDLAALLAGGVAEIRVLAKPHVIIIPTGDELVAPQGQVRRGEIPEFNSAAIAAYLEQWGATSLIWSIVPDNLASLTAELNKALTQADLVVVNAGSSAGSQDFTSQAVASLGELLVHGVATRPGKPSILGAVASKPVIGLPGYPVSAYLALEWFVRPLLYRYWGRPEPERLRVRAVAGRRIVSELGIEEFIRVTVGYINGEYIANPLGRGAGITMSLVRAHGLLVIPAHSLGVEQGDRVEVELYRTETELRHTLVAVGSHDQSLDLLGTYFKERDPRLSLSSAHVGSMGGISAIGAGQAHFAGIHLFEQASGEYNIPFIRRLLPNQPVILVNFAYRTQGWLLPNGNPLNLRNISDLLKEGIRYINRQRGAGTRLLFDYLLEQAGIGPEQIYGYQREEYTHLNVAAAVAAGTADLGLGVFSAAKAYGLDFIPVAEERYDLLMSKDFYDSDSGKILMAILTSPQYKQEVENLGGYSLREAGRILYQQ